MTCTAAERLVLAPKVEVDTEEQKSKRSRSWHPRSEIRSGPGVPESVQLATTVYGGLQFVIDAALQYHLDCGT